MKTLINTALFAIFNNFKHTEANLKSVADLRVAYEEFIETTVRLADKEDDLFLHLRRLNYTHIELVTLIKIVHLTAGSEYDRRAVLVFLGKTVAFIDDEVRVLKMKMHGSGGGSPASPLRWTGSQRDLVELCTALSESGSVSTTKNLSAKFSEILHGMEGLFAVKVREAYVCRNQLFERANDCAPFLKGLLDAFLLRVDEKLK